MRKIKLNKDTEMTVDVIKYVLDIHKEEAKRINKLKDYYNNKEVTKISARSFMDKNVSSIKLGKNIKIIERYAFSGCVNLEEINLENVTRIERNAFENCYNLKEIKLCNADILSGAFINCENLEEVELNNVKSLGSLCFAFTKIETISIPSTVSFVGKDAFYGCNSLKKIYIYGNLLMDNEYLNGLNIVIFK